MKLITNFGQDESPLSRWEKNVRHLHLAHTCPGGARECRWGQGDVPENL